jgi:hypothetical protein
MTDSNGEWANRLREIYPWLPEEVYCGSGWAKLIEDLCKKIQKFLNAHDDYCREFCVTQCKEKYGHFMFYAFPELDEIELLIDDASMTAAFTCEVCGSPGRIGSEGWVVVLCDECREQRPHKKKVQASR